MVSSPFQNVRLSDNSLVLRDLSISFQRTIRVPDGNQQKSELPPSMGKFPLFPVADYTATTPERQVAMTPEMAAKGGLFLPIHDQEAMWIRFGSAKPYMIKIFVGGVNAISGEPAVETAAIKARRAQRIARGESVQDYIVVPYQHWLDGFATKIGLVRQFVATPMGTGYSVEQQITGQEVTGGLQMEVTPLKDHILVRMMNGRVITVWGSGLISGTVWDAKRLLGTHREWRSATKKEGILSLWRKGVELRNADFLSNRGVRNGDTLNARPRSGSMTVQTRCNAMVQMIQKELPVRTKDANAGIPGSSRAKSNKVLQRDQRTLAIKEMNVAAGGIITQKIMPDPFTRPGYTHATTYLSDSDSDSDSDSETMSETDPGTTSSATITGSLSDSSDSDTSSDSDKTITGTETDITHPWDTTKTVKFNIQLLNAATFTAITGMIPHPSPITATTYAQYGYPFFKMPPTEPATNVAGDFGNLQSIAQMQGVEEDEVFPGICQISKYAIRLRADHRRDGDLDPETFFVDDDRSGNGSGKDASRSVEDLERGVKRMGVDGAME